MKKQTSKKPKIETIIKRIVREVKLGKKDPSILNQLCNLTEYVERKNYNPEEFVDAFPICAGRTYQEIKFIRKSVFDILSEELKNTDHSMLTTYRIYIALYVLNVKKYIPKSNPKVKLCDTLWGIDNTGNFQLAFKMLSLMDDIIENEKQ